MSHYLDRKRCEEAGLGYDWEDVAETMQLLHFSASLRDVKGLDQLATQLNLQTAAFLESQYERAGVITKGGEAKEPEKSVAALCAPWMDINLLDPDWQKKWDASHPKR